MATLPRSTVHETTEPSRLRLQLRPGAASEPDRAPGADGAWWPHSRDLQAEASTLVDHFPPGVGRINRLLLSRPDWDDVVTAGRGVRRIQAARGPVKVGAFPRDDTRLMILSMANGSTLRLSVIPSDTEPHEGQRLLDLAGATGDAAGDAGA